MICDDLIRVLQVFDRYVRKLEALEAEIASRGEYDYLRPSRVLTSPSI